MLTSEIREQWARDGYAVVPQLFTREEVEGYKAHYMDLRSRGSYEGDMVGVDANSNDPLKKFPRMIHMHRWDDRSLRWLIDPRLIETLAGLTGAGDPIAVQTMIYFKPPGARGQALHQDNYYLRAQPSTCVAAWLALDDCDIENGCMRVVPGSQNWPTLCAIKADTSKSFTDVAVPVPEGEEVRPIIMRAGDVLFFNGQLVHGSAPNVTPDRFRRALIAHYVQGDAQALARWYHPVINVRDGSVIPLEMTDKGGRCGEWVDVDGRRSIEMTGMEAPPARSE